MQTNAINSQIEAWRSIDEYLLGRRPATGYRSCGRDAFGADAWTSSVGECDKCAVHETHAEKLPGNSGDERKGGIMAIRHLLLCVVLGGFIVSTLPFTAPPAEAAQTTVKKKNKQADEKKQQQKHGKKKYPWGEPNAGWEDRCIFFYDTYDGWIPPYCRPYGRTY